MIDPNRLEEAIGYRDRLRELITFKRGAFGGHGPWKGDVQISFGTYAAELAMGCADIANAVLQALQAEEAQLRTALDNLHVLHGDIGE